MRLRAAARVALTLGPQMPLSKLTQAARRMRQLSKGQSLALIVPQEVACLVRMSCALAKGVPLAAAHVVQWAVGNTAQLNMQARARLRPSLSLPTAWQCTRSC
jgi:hypothetical protein